MADIIEELKQLRKEFEGLNRTFTTTQVVKIDLKKIKEELADELKRDLQGRTSYGIGI
jgi:hypothetical protein